MENIKLLLAEGGGTITIHISITFFPLNVPFDAMKAEDQNF